MGHENMTDDPEELERIAFALRIRVADAKYRVVMLEAELILVEKKIKKLTPEEGKES